MRDEESPFGLNSRSTSAVARQTAYALAQSLEMQRCLYGTWTAAQNGAPQSKSPLSI